MIECGGVFLPDGEKHLVEWMTKRNHIVDGKLTYQYHKLESALKYVTNWNFAIDAGAHCGLWSMHLAKRFRWVLAFEPHEEHRACFERNVQAERYILQPVALGDRIGEVGLRRHGESSGDTVVIEGATGVKMSTLDEEIGFGPFEGVGFLKIDVEGYEHHIVAGGEKTIRFYKPVICVEQKPAVMERNFGTREPKAVRLLESWGYRVRDEISGDYILTA